MDSRQSGNDGEGCRNDGERAGNDGLVLWSPYPKLGLTGTFTSPMAKAGVPGWQATAGLSPQPCHSAPRGHVASHPHPPLSETGVREANSSRFDRLEEGMDTLEEKVTGIQMTSSVPTPKLWVMPVGGGGGQCLGGSADFRDQPGDRGFSDPESRYQGSEDRDQSQ